MGNNDSEKSHHSAEPPNCSEPFLDHLKNLIFLLAFLQELSTQGFLTPKAPLKASKPPNTAADASVAPRLLVTFNAPARFDDAGARRLAAEPEGQVACDQVFTANTLATCLGFEHEKSGENMIKHVFFSPGSLRNRHFSFRINLFLVGIGGVAMMQYTLVFGCLWSSAGM